MNRLLCHWHAHNITLLRYMFRGIRGKHEMYISNASVRVWGSRFEYLIRIYHIWLYTYSYIKLDSLNATSRRVVGARWWLLRRSGWIRLYLAASPVPNCAWLCQHLKNMIWRTAGSHVYQMCEGWVVRGAKLYRQTGLTHWYQKDVRNGSGWQRPSNLWHTYDTWHIVCNVNKM